MTLTADIRPTAFKARPFKGVFRRHEEAVAEWPVASRQAGEERIAETLGALACAKSARGSAPKGMPCHVG